MPHFCSVIKCSMRAERDKVSFFRFPAALTNRGDYLNALSIERRNAWVEALKRGPLSASHLKHGRVCSRHFITGKPAALEDKTNPDWLPNQNLGYISTVQPSEGCRSSRSERALERVKVAGETQSEVVAAENPIQEFNEPQQEEISAKQIQENCVSESVQTDVPIIR